MTNENSLGGEMFSLWGCVDKALAKPREKREIKSWHASGFGSCPTGRWLERMGLPPDEEFDERTLRVFSAGSKFEDWVLDLAYPNLPEGIGLDRQVRIELPEWDVSGYADAVVRRFLRDPSEYEADIEPMPVWSLVYEVKSKHSNAFHWMQKKGEGPMRQHQMQLWLYLKALGIPEGRLLYISKDDLSFLEYPVMLDDERLAAEVEAEALMMKRSWDEKLPPPPIADPKAWQNNYCRWHKQCIKQPKYLEM